MNFYIVRAKCGHVGKKKYIEVDFPIIAKTGREAAQKVLRRSKVKKQLKNAISSVCLVTKDLFDSFVEKFNNDKYIHAHSKQEWDISKYEIKELYFNAKKSEFKSRIERVNYILKKQKILMEAKQNEFIFI